MKKKRILPDMSPETLTQMAATRHAAKVKAAQICLAQTFPLTGIDIPLRGLTAECVALAAVKERFAFVREALLNGASEASLRSLVMGEGEYGSDRLCALWWASIRYPIAFFDPAQIEQCIKGLYRPITDLVKDKWLHSDALLLVDERDQSYWKREQSRKEHAAFQREMLELAKEKPC